MFVHDARTTTRVKTRLQTTGLGVLVWLILCALPLALVHAQQQSPSPAPETNVPALTPRVTAPALADHRFTSTSTIRGPFISTCFGNTLAVGVAPGSSIPIAVVNGQEIIWETGDVFFSTLQIEYQHAVKEWVGFWMNIALAGRLGTETASLLSQGVTVTSGFRLGWLVRLMQTNDMALSGTAQVINAGYTAVDLVGFVEDVIDDGLTDDDKLVYSSSLMIAKTGLSYAWAISRTTGLTAAADVGYGESPDRLAGNDWYFDAGAAVDFDLRREIPVPIGAAVGVRTTSIPESDLNVGNSMTNTVIRIDYIGRHDLNIGLEIASLWQDVRDSDRSLRYTTFGLDFRYYF